MKFDEIISKIRDDIENPEGYLNLADYYMDKNTDLAFLSLENSMFFDKNPERRNMIRNMMEELRSEGVISVAPVSFIILSYHNLDYTKGCIESIRMTCVPGSYEIVVVDNGSEDEVVDWLRAQKDIILVANKENRGFPGGCNQGIEKAAKGNDIFLLNNDTVLMPNSLYCMRMALYSDKKYGSVGAMSSNAPNDQMEQGIDNLEICIKYSLKYNVPDPQKYEKKIWLVGYALLIRHDVREQVGLLDEIFSPGNYEDNDYCYRILEKGYQNVLCHDSIIMHFGGKGFDLDNTVDQYNDLCKTNCEKLRKKWGMNIDYYTHRRDELIKFIEQDHPDHNDEFSVLECGCGMGATLLRIQYLYPNSRIYGIEISDKAAELGMVNCNIRQGNIELLDLKKIIGEKLDYIIFGDVLEHLTDPYEMLRKCKSILNKNGQIIASLPNIMHFSVMIPLLQGKFRFDNEGIRDYTHLHNFTYDNICTMFNDTGYSLEEMRYVIVDRKQFAEVEDIDLEWFIPISESQYTAPEMLFKVFQYLIRAKKE